MAITPDKAAIEAAGLEYIEPTEIVKDTGPKALNLLAQAVVDGLGGGSGVREVSGTVTLDATGPRILEFYTVGAATIGGVQFPEDTAVVFRRTADGAWSHLTVDWYGGVTTITPTAPTFTDDPENGGGAWSTPTITGVTYSPASGTATPGQSVTVTATAQPGYVLQGTSSWQHTFPTAAQTQPSWPSSPNAYQQAVAADLPAQYWTLDDADAPTVVPGFGTEPIDLTPVGPVTFAAARIGTASPTSANFAEGGYLMGPAGSPGALSGNLSHTVEAILRPNNLIGVMRFLSVHGGSGSDQYSTYGLWDTKGSARVMTVSHNSTASILPAGSAFHLAYVVEGDDVEMWINGVLAETVSEPTVAAALAGPIILGANYKGDGDWYPGRVSDVAIYTGRLSGARILAHAQAAGLAA